MRYYLLFLLLFPISVYASTKNNIKNNLNNTNNAYFKFIQKIDKKVEKGECKILYPKKIYCKYEDVFEKVLASDGKSLVINSKKHKGYMRYNIKSTALNLLLDKTFLIKRIDEINRLQENGEAYFFNIQFNNMIVTVFFDKTDFNLIGWKTVDSYQNKVETKLFNIKTNIMIDEKIFRVQNYIN